MSKPIIELRSVKVHTGLSEETPAYTAKLFVDGAYFAELSNQGHGGPDMVDSMTWGPETLEALEQRIAETYPKTDMSKYDMADMDESLECICHGLVWEFVDKRNMKSRLSRTVMTFEDGKVYTWKGKKTEERMDAIHHAKPEAIILNRLAFAEAWDLIKDAA